MNCSIIYKKIMIGAGDDEQIIMNGLKLKQNVFLLFVICFRKYDYIVFKKIVLVLNIHTIFKGRYCKT